MLLSLMRCSCEHQWFGVLLGTLLSLLAVGALLRLPGMLLSLIVALLTLLDALLSLLGALLASKIDHPQSIEARDEHVKLFLGDERAPWKKN